MSYDKSLIAHKLLRWEKAVSGYSLPKWENIPDIGLYMDQVIVLLSQYRTERFFPPRQSTTMSA